MPGFRNLRELTDAQDAGQYLYASWRKQPTQSTGAGIWFDLSMSPGNPAPNYYIGSPNVFTPMRQSTDGGLRHGGNVNALGKKKFLRKLMAQTATASATPLSCILMDYVGFYPFIDESVLDEQFMDNSVSVPRYVDNSPEFYGPELVTNGDFSNGTTGWSGGAYGATLSVTDGVLRATRTGSIGLAGRAVTVVVGKTYCVTASSVDSSGGGNVDVRLGNSPEQSQYFRDNSSPSPKTYSVTFTATSSVLEISLFFAGAGIGSWAEWDNISVKEILAPSKYPSLQMMPVVVAGQTGGQPFTVKYTNQDGVAGRITQGVTMSTQFVNGTILHSMQANASYTNNGPFLPLQIGDSGVRSVESVTIGGIGDVGLFSLVLVKPLSTFSLFGIDAPTEVDYWQDMASMPEILDDAFLNMVALPNGNLSGAPINGILETTWN